MFTFCGGRGRIFIVYSPSKLQFHNTVLLTIDIMLNVRSSTFTYLFLKRFYLFIFRERGREEEREGEKYQCVVASRLPPTGDLAHNPGLCLTRNQTGNPWFTGHAQSTELHLATAKLYISYNWEFAPFYLPLPISSTLSSWHPFFYSILMSTPFFFFYDYTRKSHLATFIFLWLILLSIMPSRFIQVVTNNRISIL